ncbi:MAG: hypothetical protein U1E43_01125 [Rhodospirillales bacterium]
MENEPWHPLTKVPAIDSDFVAEVDLFVFGSAIPHGDSSYENIPYAGRIEQPCLFLKVDTQGYDLEVIKGAAGVMQHIVGLQSELSVMPIYKDMPHYTQCLEYYESLGFSLMHLALVNRTRQGNILEYDCLMARVPELDSH